jgi:hypothetical protein
MMNPILFTLVILLASISFCNAAGEVRYKDFGAVGDGKTDDFSALMKAHEHANKKGLPVKADSNAVYYIGGTDKTITIMTNTDFGSASFIIDDTKLKNRAANVFEVRSEQKHFLVKDVMSLAKGQTKIKTALKSKSPCLIIVTNDKVKRFIRFGKNKNSGKAQTDVFLTDQHGQVDPKTPIIWDFDTISKMVAYPIDKEKLTIKGGTFTTIANSNKSTDYHKRGIGITRSNVIIEGIKHLIKGEGEVGPPYQGFIAISNCANVTIRDSEFSGRKVYYKIGNAGSRTPMGTYGLSITSAVNVSLLRCTQMNDIMDKTIWGIMGTNFCKNITLDTCKLSRFDAHMGVTNATIRNSTLGYMGVKLTGFGRFLIENTTVKSTDFINLRPDYGSTWDGEIMIRNCRFEPTRISNTLNIISGTNNGQHDFGYTTHLPSKVVIDNLFIADSKHQNGYKGPAILGNFNPSMKDASYKSPHPQVITKMVAHREVKTESSKPLRTSDNEFMFRDVKVYE